MVRTLPAASVLRAAYPHARLTWLVEPPAASLLEELSWLDEVLVFPRPELRRALVGARLPSLVRDAGRLVRSLRDRHFDLVVDFHSILRSGVLSWLSGAPRRVGYAPPFGREGAHWFATELARLSPRRQSRFDRNEALVRYLGLDQAMEPRPLAVSPARLELARKALGPGPAPVALHPGTSDGTAHKRWTPEGYGALARALAEDGTPSIVTCGPARDDRAFADAVIEAAGGAARAAPTTASLLDLAAVFQASRLYVGGDTGPLHVASLVGTPVLQLMGPTDPIENQPFGETPSRRVRVQIGCNPCRRGCAAAACMRAIHPDAVIQAARGLLATQRVLR